MRRKSSPPAPRALVTATDEGGSLVTLKADSIRDLLRRLGHGFISPQLAGSEAALARQDPPPQVRSVEDQLNAALGCKTSAVTLKLLAQIMKLENPVTEETPENVERLLENAVAMLAELEPTTATEALLAAQMVGAQRLAMEFMGRATLDGQTPMGADANVLRATRLMRIFNEQVETMARLKGTNGQQRVVVEHVTVTAGGQAIVGAMLPGGRGTGGDDQR